MKYLLLILALAVTPLLSLAEKNDKHYYQENFRPQFHFTPEKNWMNDPNGLVYYAGEYHLFYQYNPFGKEWGYMHWGHAVSKDLIHWEHLPIALTPDDNSKDKSHATAFSGCALVDENNVTGLQQGNEKTLLAFYTSFECGQRLAYSNDKGRTWNKFAQNPLIPFEKDDARDPHVFFHKASGKWVMALYRRPNNEEAKQGISFYTSADLIHWQWQSHTEGYFECPDFFELPIDGQGGNTKWVLLDASGDYQVGTFDGKQFKAETVKKKLDRGKNFYATQTWSNGPGGKLIQLAWMRGGEYPDMPFNGQMTFPCELSLHSGKGGPILCRKPIEAISLLFDKHLIKKDKNIIPGLNGNILSGMDGKSFYIKGIFDVKSADAFGFLLRSGKKEVGTEIRYETDRKLLSCLGTNAVVDVKNGLLELEILVDWSSIEIFANGGEVSMSNCFTPIEKDEGFSFWTQGGELMIKHLEVYQLKSAWSKK